MFLRKRWFASRPGVSLLGTHKKASTRERFWSNWSQTEKVRRIQQCSSFKNPLPRYLPGKMMTDVALNIHFKVDKHFLTKYFGNICYQPMGKYITWFPITLTHTKKKMFDLFNSLVRQSAVSSSSMDVTLDCWRFHKYSRQIKLNIE